MSLPRQIIKPSDLIQLIDHTQLRPEASEADIQKACEEANEFGFRGLCISPQWVSFARAKIKNPAVRIVTVLGFPTGAVATAIKIEEAKRAVQQGADELDMVLNRSWLPSRELGLVYDDIRAVVSAAQGRLVKVILETSELETEDKVIASALAIAAGADFLKTSTGFSRGGATEHDVQLLRRIAGPDKGVKASGGIRDYATAKRMVEAGANRLGTSASVAIVTDSGGSSPSGGY